MMIRTTAFAALCAILLPAATFADSFPIVVEDAYVRSASPMSGAAFMTLRNDGDTADRLVAAGSDAAERVELHTHSMDANGVMRMTEIEGGLPLDAGASAEMKRGGDHVMLMGLTRKLETGDAITVTLTFEQAGDMTVEIPVDNDR
jgi:copper(I)-binding protein